MKAAGQMAKCGAFPRMLPYARRTFVGVAAMAAVCGPLSGCKIMTIEEDRQAKAEQTNQFDAGQFVSKIWAKKALPYLQEAAKPIATLLPATEQHLSTAGGRQAGEGSPWTFVVQGRGVVKSIDQSSRMGVVVVAVQTDHGPREVSLRSGPVVLGTTVRDALPFISFNDFSDQVAYAQVGNALTARATQGTLAQLSNLRPGDAVSFLGVFAQATGDDPVVITVVQVLAP